MLSFKIAPNALLRGRAAAADDGSKFQLEDASEAGWHDSDGQKKPALVPTAPSRIAHRELERFQTSLICWDQPRAKRASRSKFSFSAGGNLKACLTWNILV